MDENADSQAPQLEVAPPLTDSPEFKQALAEIVANPDLVHGATLHARLKALEKKVFGS